uniref:PID domain-containing protein n=1 Tax=Amazona collaria TaxID=241587 RepID=A0A8B9FQK0_9PSIT
MQSISFASGGDTDTTDYVAYVAKDPINQRACHILECCEGLAQSVISTVGQAFELRFKQYLPGHVPGSEPLRVSPDSAWGEDEDAAEHDYYNSIPGKEPPPGGLIDSRLRLQGWAGCMGTLLARVQEHCGPPNPQVRTKDVLFESISHLISHHRQNEQPIVAAESELHLRQVVQRKQ